MGDDLASDSWDKEDDEAMSAFEAADRIPGVPPGEHRSRGSEWRQIRLFISSTFRDMHPERSFLVNRTLKELGAFCKELCLHLLVCDLRWGVKPGTSAEMTIRTCLGEVTLELSLHTCLLSWLHTD